MAISGKCSAVGKIELDPVVFVQRRPPEIRALEFSKTEVNRHRSRHVEDEEAR